MKNKYLLLSIALLSSGTALAMEKEEKKSLKQTASEHENPQSNKKAKTEEESFKCDYPGCNYATKTIDNLKKHKLIHTNERPFRCDHPSCNYATNLRNNFINHYQSPHILLECMVCFFDCYDQTELDQHIQEHPTCVDYPACQYRGFTNAVTQHIKEEHQQRLDNNRLLLLLASNDYIQSSFSTETLLNMNRK